MGGGASQLEMFFHRWGCLSHAPTPEPGGAGSLLLLLPFLSGDDRLLRRQIFALTSTLMGLGFADDVDRQSLLTRAFTST